MKVGLKEEKRVLVTPEEGNYPMHRVGGSVGGNRIWIWKSITRLEDELRAEILWGDSRPEI